MIAVLLVAGVAIVYAGVRVRRANSTVERILTEALRTRINDQAAADRAEAGGA